MPHEVGTEATRSDAPSADESLFGDAAGDKAAPVVQEEDPNDAVPDAQGGQGSDDVGEQAAGDATEASENLKVVVSIKGGRATIGVQQPSSDPHIETFDNHDLAGTGAGGLGGDREGEGQVGRRTQAPRSRQTRSPGQATDPA